jgi:hypothetical protein
MGNDSGANFMLVISQPGTSYTDITYAESKFMGQSHFMNGVEADLQKFVADNCYKLSDLVTRDKYPTNEEVLKQLGPIFGIVAGTSTAVTSNAGEPVIDTPAAIDTGDDIPYFSSNVSPTVEADTTSINESNVEDDDFFETLLNTK